LHKLYTSFLLKNDEGCVFGVWQLKVEHFFYDKIISKKPLFFIA